MNSAIEVTKVEAIKPNTGNAVGNDPLTVLRQFDRAVYRNIICNPSNGLTEEQFQEVALAHAKALPLL